MKRFFLKILCLVLILSVGISSISAASLPKSEKTQVISQGETEIISVAIGNAVFAFSPDEDPNLVISEINRILGYEAVTSLDNVNKYSSLHGYAARNNTADASMDGSSSESAITLAVVIKVATFAYIAYQVIAQYPDFKIGVKEACSDVYWIVNGVTAFLWSGTGYSDVSNPYYSSPLFDCHNGVISWY